MGNWAIHIEGVGCHHNGADFDADQIAKEAVRKLKEHGHTVTHAKITHGGEDDLLVLDEDK